jgi:hypothetical protein
MNASTAIADIRRSSFVKRISSIKSVKRCELRVSGFGYPFL